MIVVPIVMAAIRNAPPRISQWIGLAPVECRTRNDAVLSAVMGPDRCPGLKRQKQISYAPAQHTSTLTVWK
jgi:hypothetical protein